MLRGFSTIHKRNLIETKNVKIGAIWATADKLSSKLSSDKCNNYLSDRVSTIAVKCIITLLPTHGKHAQSSSRNRLPVFHRRERGVYLEFQKILLTLKHFITVNVKFSYLKNVQIYEANQIKVYLIISVPTLLVIIYIVFVAWHISGAGRVRTEDK